MSAPKSAEGKRRARKKYLETTRTRSIPELREGLAQFGKKLRHYDGPCREDIEKVGRIVGLLADFVTTTPADEKTLETIETLLRMTLDAAFAHRRRPRRKLPENTIDFFAARARLGAGR